MQKVVVAIVTTVLIASPLLAWDGTGHMTVAYIAYKNLTDDTRQRVDELLKLNPEYKTWTKGVPKKRKGLIAFVNAATWPDCIKTASKCPGFTTDGTDNGDTPPPGFMNMFMDTDLVKRTRKDRPLTISVSDWLLLSESGLP